MSSLLKYLKNNISKLRNFLLTVAMAQSNSDDSAMLCTSGFVDDIMFSHNGANGPESKTTLHFI